jgi:hypothetical protein
VSAIDQNREANHVGATECSDGVQRCSCGSPREQNVVDEDHGGPINTRRRDFRRYRGASGLSCKIVTVHGDVEGPHLNVLGFDIGDESRESPSQVDTSSRDSQKNQTETTALRFDYLMRDARESPVDVGLRENDTCHSLFPFPPHRTL